MRPPLRQVQTVGGGEVGPLRAPGVVGAEAAVQQHQRVAGPLGLVPGPDPGQVRVVAHAFRPSPGRPPPQASLRQPPHGRNATPPGSVRTPPSALCPSGGRRRGMSCERGYVFASLPLTSLLHPGLEAHGPTGRCSTARRRAPVLCHGGPLPGARRHPPCPGEQRAHETARTQTCPHPADRPDLRRRPGPSPGPDGGRRPRPRIRSRRPGERRRCRGLPAGDPRQRRGRDGRAHDHGRAARPLGAAHLPRRHPAPHGRGKHHHRRGLSTSTATTRKGCRASPSTPASPPTASSTSTTRPR